MNDLIEKYIELVRISNPHLTDDEIDVLFYGKEHPNIVKHLYLIDITTDKGFIITKRGELDEIRKKWKETRAANRKKQNLNKPPSPYKLFIKEQYSNYLHLPVKERLPAIGRAWTEMKKGVLPSD